jgi:hypothetical protein
MRSQGKPKQVHESSAESIQSDLKGTFSLSNGTISLSELEFRIPGTSVNLTGTYRLDGNDFDFRGKARFDAKLSHILQQGWCGN